MAILKKFPNPLIAQKEKLRNKIQYYKKKESFHIRVKNTAEEMSNGCWWLESFFKMYPNKLKK